jgi:hypothetical protein
LSETKQKIRLVFGLVGWAGENPAAADFVEVVAGVVAGGDAVGADLAGGDEELVELEVVVAEGAGDGVRPARYSLTKGFTTSASKRSC